MFLRTFPKKNKINNKVVFKLRNTLREIAGKKLFIFCYNASNVMKMTDRESTFFDKYLTVFFLAGDCSL